MNLNILAYEVTHIHTRSLRTFLLHVLVYHLCCRSRQRNLTWLFRRTSLFGDSKFDPRRVHLWCEELALEFGCQNLDCGVLTHTLPSKLLGGPAVVPALWRGALRAFAPASVSEALVRAHLLLSTAPGWAALQPAGRLTEPLGLPFGWWRPASVLRMFVHLFDIHRYSGPSRRCARSFCSGHSAAP